MCVLTRAKAAGTEARFHRKRQDSGTARSCSLRRQLMRRPPRTGSLSLSLSLALALWTANGPGIKPPARLECHQGRCRWARPSAGPWTEERDPRSDCPGPAVANGSWTRALLLSLRRSVVGLYFPLRVGVVCIVVVCNRAEEFLGLWEILALTRDLLNVVSSSHALRG